MSVQYSNTVVRRHFSRPQLLSLVIDANTEVAEINRGGGKTSHITAPWLTRRTYAMPRSRVGLLTVSFKKLFGDLFPSILRSWDELGYIEGKHYTVRKPGPVKWERPYDKMIDWSNAVHFSCGSGIVGLSLDRPTMNVGLSLDALAVEEARWCDGETIMGRVRQTVRGNTQYFGHLSCHHSMLIVTDKGENAHQRWYQKVGMRMDPEQVLIIQQLYYRRQQLRSKLEDTSLSPRTLADYKNEVALLSQSLNDLRKTATFFNTGTALDNIEQIGWENFLAMEQQLDPAVFARSMMNEDVDYVVGAWYNGFDASRHCYIPETTSFTSSKGLSSERDPGNDSRHDAEINPGAPLDIALDYGGNFNCMAVGQMFHDLLRIDRGFHAVHPGTTEDVVLAFCHHYRYHKRKEVYYYWDHTAKDPHGGSRFRYFEIVQNTLRDQGWHVNSIEIGRTPAPAVRYEMFNKIFKAPEPPVMWNPDGCADMITSMKLTRIRQGRDGNGIRKNKDAEKEVDNLELHVHAPHYGDAVDTLVWGRFESLGTHAPPPVVALFT